MSQGGSDPALRAFYAERRGLKLDLIANPREVLTFDKAAQMMDRKINQAGLQIDYRKRSPLVGNAVRYMTGTNVRQWIDRKASFHAKERFLMLTLRTTLYMKKGGKLGFF